MPQVIPAVIATISSFAATATFKFVAIAIAAAAAGSLITKALAGDADAGSITQGGIQTDVTTSGGTVPQKFVVGTYATAGHAVSPPFSHGLAGRTPNAYLNYIIEVSNIKGVGLSRVVVDDDYKTIGTTPDPDYGLPLLEFREGGEDHGWVKFLDGTQTVVDAMLLDRYGSHPERPWAATAIGKDTAYVIMTFLFNREIFNGLPKVTFELTGIDLYDPRLDTSVGGAGTQRFNDPTTWAFSDNPIVIIYNIMRGIDLPTGDTWGGGIVEADLPLSNWFAGMNICDVLIGTRKTYRAGFEINVQSEPAEVIDELLKVCFGQMTEFGGVFKVRVGAPSASIFSITDDDIVVSQKQELDPFPGLESTFNAISATYPEPESLWESSEAPPIYNALWEAEDFDRRLPVEMSFAAAPFLSQVQHLMNGYIEDERRFRVHRLTLPPDAAILEPLDSIDWTSARKGYTN